MEVFFEFIYADPYVSIAALFAFFGAMALLMLVSGFFAGFRYVLSMDGHDEHMEHYRFYATWGVLLLFLLFTVWQIIRLLAGFFTNSPGPSGTTLFTTALVWAIYFGIYQFAIKHTK